MQTQMDAEDAAAAEEAETRADILREERMKLLHEAAALRNFLPSGTLTKDDTEMMQKVEER